MAVPTELRIRRATRCLEVAFEDERRLSLPAEYLRVESPSAEVQGHAPHEKQLVAGKQDVNIAAVEPIGNYAVRIRFTDGHDTGIYSWTLLEQLGREYDRRWAAYLAALAERGLRRNS
jgi:DUF971 family protein